MAWDFWNNPIVISAFRVKYRRIGPFRIVTTYLLLLLTAAAGLQASDFRLLNSYPLTCFVCLMGLQCVLSFMVAMNATRVSIKREVDGQTLDFQRIAALSPRQILLGKLLGEPAMAYLMAIATIPLAIVCWLGGAVSFPVLVLAYVNLATTTFMGGVFGLQAKIDRQGGSATGFVILLLFMGVYVRFLGRLASALNVPWISALVGLGAPIVSLEGIAADDPWIAVTLFGVGIPFLMATPVVQLLIAALYFHAMERQLIYPLNPRFSKAMAYGTLAAIDLVMAGVLFDMGPWTLSPGLTVVAFWLAHFGACLLLLLEALPSKESLHSWVWRRRGQPARERDYWLGERSEISRMLAGFCGIGLFSLLGVVLVPAIFRDGLDAVCSDLLVIGECSILTTLVILSVGAFLQYGEYEGGRGGAVGVLMVIVAPLLLGPLLAGIPLQSEWLVATSPAGWFVNWLSEEPLPAFYLGLVLPVYGLLWVYARWSLRQRLGLLAREVQNKLVEMDVKEGAASVT
jgi:hypothetical protein